jgi:hypothetical protein
MSFKPLKTKAMGPYIGINAASGLLVGLFEGFVATQIGKSKGIVGSNNQYITNMFIHGVSLSFLSAMNASLYVMYEALVPESSTYYIPVSERAFMAITPLFYTPIWYYSRLHTNRAAFSIATVFGFNRARFSNRLTGNNRVVQFAENIMSKPSVISAGQNNQDDFRFSTKEKIAHTVGNYVAMVGSSVLADYVLKEYYND